MAFPPNKGFTLNNILITIMVIFLIGYILWAIAIPTEIPPTLNGTLIVIGLGFVLAAFFKLHQHQMAPIPKIIFIFATAGWLVMVIKAMLASPLMFQVGLGIVGVCFIIAAIWKAHQHKPEIEND